jgi:F-type H+-transporting ATPase subunit a
LAVVLGLSLSLFWASSAVAQNHNTAGHNDPHGTLENASAGDHKEGDTKHVNPDDDPSQIIIHHVMDSHDWHFFDYPSGDGYKPFAIHLPWLLYTSETGLVFFANSEALNEDPHFLVDSHDHLYYVTDKHPDASVSEHVAHEDTTHHYAIVGHGSHKTVYAMNPVHGVSVMDFSLTKTGLQILIVCIVMLLIFIRIASRYKKNPNSAPKGIQSFFEPVIIFVRDEVAKPFLGETHYLRFTPYLLTLFFFIWFSNIFGLTPLSSNIAGNTSITLALAALTFILILANSKKDFWLHIFWFPGVPIWLKPLMFVVEFLGMITKPAALAIRLFANISAGHFMILALICLIFILGKNGESIGGGVAIAPLSVIFSLFIYVVEVLVAAVQAFVFTLLTAVFIGQAMESHDHDEHHAAEHH